MHIAGVFTAYSAIKKIAFLIRLLASISYIKRALEEGLPYQTFIASILHKYASGRLLEKPSNLVRSAG